MLNRSTLFDFDSFEIWKSYLLLETSFGLCIRDVHVR